ncbi:hypothetical protein SmJEL517_g05452 [Synchytrium microbalum]|uniref:Sugar phosphate transporter domain-containing protein n=1 Tax=Synchytrium microbalum TaxID=1806994 RepID=A0A507BZE1_9FUNG|nr:uncharacterized protein SmJEL517_g05452 [Synchytrium microbalum]TPX31116.1 hypothetical protein SmJEL517_g05452 [Synchytrium microbalum]
MVNEPDEEESDYNVKNKTYNLPTKWEDGWERKAILVTLYICGWYTTSIFLSMYNKWLLSPNYHGFGYPLFVTGWHMIVQTVLSWLVLGCCLSNYRPKHAPSIWLFFTRVIPCGMATGIDIGLSATSLTQISVSFYTMVKSSAPVFVLMFAILFGLERPSTNLILSVLVIVIGVALMVSDGSGTTSFNWIGFAEVQSATIASGFRWALTQILLSRVDMGMNNPLATTVILAPVMALSLLTACAIIEGFGVVFASPFFSTASSALTTLGIITGGGFIAFALTMVEYLLITTTSVLTFSVAGIVKEIITISISTAVFGDTFTPMNVVGLVISLVGILGYNVLRISAATSTSRNGDEEQDFYKRVQDDEEDADEIEVEDEVEGYYVLKEIARRNSRQHDDK